LKTSVVPGEQRCITSSESKISPGDSAQPRNPTTAIIHPVLIRPRAGSRTQFALYVSAALEAGDLIFDHIVATLPPVTEYAFAVVIGRLEQIAAVFECSRDGIVPPVVEHRPIRSKAASKAKVHCE